MQRISYYVILFLLVMTSSFRFVYAEQFNSTNFTVLDPVLVPSGFGTSAAFQLWGSLSEIAIGTSTVTDFGVNSGFLFYPEVTIPVVTSSVGDSKVDLSWTVSEGFLGWTASSYAVGQSTISGGPYTYTSLGNVFSSTRTGLLNNTSYYFVVVVKDVFGNAIGTSTEIVAIPTNPGLNQNEGGGSGLGRILNIAGICSENKSDLNGDGKVDLIDLSILLYYLNRPDGPRFDCNGDDKVDFVDISILFYHWTG